MELEIFSFFSGLGLLDLGFHNAGFNICFVNEVNNDFLASYKYTRDKMNIAQPEYGYADSDIRNVFTETKWNGIYEDVRKKGIVGFIGGPPCPDFSFGGKNEGGTGANGILTQVYCKMIIEKQPDFFLLENVKGLMQTKKHKDFFENLKRDLKNSGYFLVETLDNALEYGVPQYRDRLFLVGLKKSTFGETPDFQFGYGRIAALQDVLDLPWPTQNEFAVNSHIEKPLGIRENLTIQHWFDKNDVLNHTNANDYFQPKPTTLKFHSVPEGDTHGKSFKRLHRWRYSPTAAYGNNEVHLHPFKARRISISEALAVQSLPSNFELPIELPLSAKFKMVGNGVPYLMSYNIGKGLYTWLKEHIR